MSIVVSPEDTFTFSQLNLNSFRDRSWPAGRPTTNPSQDSHMASAEVSQQEDDVTRKVIRRAEIGKVSDTALACFAME